MEGLTHHSSGPIHSQPHLNIIQANKLIRQSGKINAEGLQIPTQTKFNLTFIESQLRTHDYPDFEVIKFLKFGWPIELKSELPVQTVRPKNHAGATNFKQHIDKYLETERNEEAIIGPFDSIPFEGAHLSPLNSVPKNQNSRRVILDLSFPRDRGTSINSLIENKYFQGTEINLKYPGVDELVEIIRNKGQGCLLFKRDLRRAYRQIFVDPGCVHLLGYHWEGQVYFDCVLPMGLNVAAYFCQRTTNALAFIAKQHGVDCVNYLDDAAGAETPADADAANQTLGLIYHHSGVVEAEDKIHFPHTRMPFIGIMFDTIKLTLEITPDRLIEIQELLDTWGSKSHASKTELESFTGKLSFVAACVRPGRIFLARIYNAMSLWSSGSSPIPVEMQKDIWWWQKFMKTYNGISMMPWQEFGEPDEELTTDACLLGGGATLDGQHFACRFPDWLLETKPNINYLEFLVIIIAAKVWKRKLRNKRIMVHCDNLVTVFIINTGRAKSRLLQKASRELAFVAATGGFEIRSQHLPGSQNRVADWLSRMHFNQAARDQFTQWNRIHKSQEVQVSHDLFQLDELW